MVLQCNMYMYLDFRAFNFRCSAHQLNILVAKNFPIYGKILIVLLHLRI